MLKEKANLVKNHIVDKNGHIYVCGDVNMAADVGKAIQEVLEKELNLSKEYANAYVKELRVWTWITINCTGNLQEDWG